MDERKSMITSGEVALSVEQFITASKRFCEISDKIGDGWKFFENDIEAHKTFIKKQCFINQDVQGVVRLLKSEYIIFYNLSYGVPSFSFNIWDASGVLLTSEEIRKMSFIDIKKEDFYSIITQQEHPVFFRPYFIIHPCHTSTLISEFKNATKNIIVTFLGFITPLLNLNLPYEYGI